MAPDNTLPIPGPGDFKSQLLELITEKERKDTKKRGISQDNATAFCISAKKTGVKSQAKDQCCLHHSADLPWNKGCEAAIGRNCSEVS